MGNLEPSDARGLFRLLDADSSGSVCAEEFFSGCLRLRGPAKALDLALLAHEVKGIAMDFKTHSQFVQTKLQELASPIEANTSVMNSASHSKVRTLGDNFSFPQ